MKKVCLVGGGHTHSLAIRKLAKLLGAKAQITLISPNRYTPYSGMIPGVVETIYNKGELFIDLQRLAEQFSVGWIEEEVVRIDPGRRFLETGAGQCLPYDVVSFNTGGVMKKILETDANVMTVKPVAEFLEWLSWVDEYEGGELDVCIVGGGAAGIEIACAVRQRIRKKLGKLPFDCRITLVESGANILAGYAKPFVNKVSRELAARGINVHVNSDVKEYGNGELHTGKGPRISADKVILSTPIEAPATLAFSVLELSKSGFILVNRFLQSISHPDVFACGDICDVRDMHYPKAGVFAVRQAQTLACNIAARCEQANLREFPSRRKYLSIINLGAHNAIASYGQWFWKGRWVWLLKNYLDRSFMNKLSA